MACQAYGCSTRQGYGKSLFCFPDPVKKKDLYLTWLANLSLEESFTSTKNKLVCEDHFETSCFEGNMMTKLLGFTSRVRRRLKSEAVPTLFSCIQDSRVDTNTATRKRELQQVPNASGTKCVGENSALTEIKENNIPQKKSCQIVNTAVRVEGAFKDRIVSSFEEELAVNISHQHDECEDSVMAEASDTIVEVEEQEKCMKTDDEDVVIQLEATGCDLPVKETIKLSTCEYLTTDENQEARMNSDGTKNNHIEHPYYAPSINMGYSSKSDRRIGTKNNHIEHPYYKEWKKKCRVNILGTKNNHIEHPYSAKTQSDEMNSDNVQPNNKGIHKCKRKMEKVTSSESTPLMMMVTSHVKNTNSIIVPVKSEILEQPESEVLPSCSNSSFQYVSLCSSYRPTVESSGSDVNNICCYRPTVESSGSDVNNICIENQNLGSVAHENNSGLIYNIKQEPVDDYFLKNVYNESQDSTQNSVVNNDSQTNSFSPIIYDTVNSNDHNRKMKEVTSFSQLKTTISGSMGDNSSHNMGDNSIIVPVKSEILEQPESEVLPSCSNPNFQMFSCSRPSTVESSGSNVNNICLESQNLGSVAHENNSGLIYSIKQEPVDDYFLTNVCNRSQDSTQNSVVNNDSQTSSFSPIIYENVNSNDHKRKIKEVASSSILNKTHVNQEKQSSTPTMVFRHAKSILKTTISGSMGDNSSHIMGDNSNHNTGGNSITNLFSDRVEVPRLQTKDSGADRLNGNQSLEPQLDNTKWRNNCLNFLKDALQNTINRLEDLGVDVAAWVHIPNNDKSSLIHQIGSIKGREFIKCKPDINTELHLFLQNYQKKDNGKKNNSQEMSKKKLEEDSCSVENMGTSSCDGEPPESISENKAIPCSILNDCKPTNVLFSVKGLDNNSSCIVVRQAENSSKEELQVNTHCTSSSYEKEKILLKRKIISVDTDPLSDDEKLSETSKEEKASIVTTCKDIFANKKVALNTNNHRPVW